MSFLLEAQELTEYLEGTDTEPDREVMPIDWKLWKKNKSRAVVILLSSVEKSLHANLISCTSPKAIWEKLISLYGDTSEDEKQSTWEQYYDFQMKNDAGVATELEKFESICRRLVDAGEKLCEPSIITKLLNSLPARFSAFTMAWECTTQADRKKENLTARILREDKRLTETEEATSSLALQANALRITNKQKDYRGTQQRKKKKLEELKKKTKCNYCHEKGHWALECKKRQANQKNHTGKEEKTEGEKICPECT